MQSTDIELSTYSRQKEYYIGPETKDEGAHQATTTFSTLHPTSNEVYLNSLRRSKKNQLNSHNKPTAKSELLKDCSVSSFLENDSIAKIAEIEKEYLFDETPGEADEAFDVVSCTLNGFQEIYEYEKGGDINSLENLGLFLDRGLPLCETFTPSYDLHTIYAKGLAMTLNRNKSGFASGFTSYIDLQPPTPTEKETSLDSVEPTLLPVEMIISKADRVCCYVTNLGGTTSGQTGSLFVTTLRLCYVPNVVQEENKKEANKLLRDLDFSLSSIHSVFELVGENGDKRKKLPLGANISHKVDAIFVLCKNFKFKRFSFKFSGVDAGRTITNTLLHHSRPKKTELLFAFEQGNHISTSSKIHSNWIKTINASDCHNLRVSRANESWQVAISLPQQFVVPGHVTDELVSQVAGLGLGSRPPVWVWGARGGGAVYIQPALNVIPSSVSDSLYDEYYGLPRRHVIYLEERLASLSSLEEGFNTLLELNTAETEKELEEKDVKYFSTLESSGWFAAISALLQLSVEVAEKVSGGVTVVLVEGEGRGPSLAVASLARILLNREARTRAGFECVVESTWVSLGFPFCKAHALSGEGGGGLAGFNPIFLLFLDCVHQIGLQFPSHLEFLPDYLICLWDTVLLPVFHTFIFDCEHDRARARTETNNPLQVHSAWDWTQQYSEKTIGSWSNPLYEVPLRPPRPSPTDPSPASMITGKYNLPQLPESKKFLHVSSNTVNLAPWSDLFQRSIPLLQLDSKLSKEVMKVRRAAKADISMILNSAHNSSVPPDKNHQNHRESKR